MPIITIKIGFNISEQKSYKECFKCHNIDVVNYFINNYLQNED